MFIRVDLFSYSFAHICVSKFVCNFYYVVGSKLLYFDKKNNAANSPEPTNT